MPDRPVARVNPEARTDNSILIGIVVAAAVALLVLLGATMFNSGDKSADMNATQPSTEAPATSENIAQ
jgi:flagellar basal body-associated protein FliL